jgi:hypothetical protein
MSRIGLPVQYGLVPASPGEAMRRGGLDLPPLRGRDRLSRWTKPISASRKTRSLRTSAKVARTSPSAAAVLLAIVLVERGGSVRAFRPARADGTSVNAIVRQNIARASRLHTDESRLHIGVGQEFRKRSKRK